MPGAGAAGGGARDGGARDGDAPFPVAPFHCSGIRMMNWLSWFRPPVGLVVESPGNQPSTCRHGPAGGSVDRSEWSCAQSDASGGR